MKINTIRVLIVDDSIRSRNGLKALLSTRPDFEIVGLAASGQEAIEQVKNCQPDVVLMDARMPHMDGIRAMQKMKNLYCNLKVIILSMYPDYRALAEKAGADLFLLKGGPADELFSAVIRQASVEAAL